MKRLLNIRILLFAFALYSIHTALYAQDNNIDIWSGIKMSRTLPNGFSVILNPELRLSDNFEQNELLMETGVAFAPIKYIQFGAKYRFSSVHETGEENDYNHQMAFDVKGKLKYNNLKFQLRTRLTNYADFEIDNYFSNPYLRYRLGAEYNIKKLNFSPFISAEIFHQIDDKEINKVRYTIGGEYKINKNNFISLEYHLQDYLKKDQVKNILAIQYKFKF